MRKERRKRKEAHIRRLEKNQRKKKAKLGSPEAAKGFGSPRRVAQPREDSDSSKEKPKEHKKQRVDTSFSGTRDPARKRRKPGVTSHSASGQYSGNQNKGL